MFTSAPFVRRVHFSALWPSLTTKTLILYTLCGDFCTESRLACTYFEKALLHTSNKALQIALV